MPIDCPLLAVPAVICRNITATGVSSEAVVPDSLREKPVKIGTNVVSHGPYVTFGWPGRDIWTDVQGNPDADRLQLRGPPAPA